MTFDVQEYLAHYGTPRHSGRYPWGSGGNEPGSTQHHRSFLDYIKQLLGLGHSEAEIAKGLGMTTTELRAQKSIAKNAIKQADIAFAERLKEKGLSNLAIGERMGINESSVRALLAPGAKDRADVLQTTASMLQDQVDSKGYIDIGKGVENHLGISKERLATAVAVLKDKGYEVHTVQVEQLGTAPGNKTYVKVLAPPGTTYRDIASNKDKIQQITEFSEDGGRSFLGIHEPLSIDSSRIGIRYAEDGGKDADGVIYVRPGVDEVSLGGAQYAQVRIAVNGTHYLKGMAMYKDDLPEGVDLVFNTNKSRTDNPLDAMKPMKTDQDGNIDKDNPFGASIDRQIVKSDSKGNERTTSVMNIVNEEGKWDEWSRNLSTQFLSKQSPELAETQLKMAYEDKKDTLEEIKSLTNPVVRQKLLLEYADSADAASVHLKAAALPRQSTHVILPVNSLKETEVYAPNYNNGERVVLIRYPHGGIFEIPELTVNNRHPAAKAILGNAPDAIGINSKVASRLSGADFDGDTVLVIPNPSGKIKTAPALEQLKNFDPQRSYPKYDGMKVMTSRQTQLEMGKVSNLITDMTIKGAPHSEIARAVRHSMVVIDAEKHELNWKQSEIDNGISNLKEKYQGSKKGGASTIVSVRKRPVNIPERRPRKASEGGPIDKKTGEKVFVNTGEHYVDKKTGKTVYKTSRVKALELAKDARTLSSGTPIENLYAEHSNRLKALANEARKEAVNTKTIPVSPSAKKTYEKEVSSLVAKLNVAKKNAPLERQAQVIANSVVSAKRQANPNLTPDEIKKVKSQALAAARARTQSGKKLIEITPSEWHAIQSGAVSTNRLTEILNHANIDTVKKLATPKREHLITSSKLARAEAMLRSGYTQAEVAQALGVGLTTLKTSLGGT